jgi:hypothetical protein
MENKICFRCKKYIGKERYFAFQEFDEEGKLIRTDYTHKKCWDDFLRLVSDRQEAMGILRRLKEPLTKMGILPEEKYKIN